MTTAKVGLGRRPINGLAARKFGDGANKPKHAELIEKA